MFLAQLGINLDLMESEYLLINKKTDVKLLVTELNDFLQFFGERLFQGLSGSKNEEESIDKMQVRAILISKLKNIQLVEKFVLLALNVLFELHQKH